MHYDGVGQDSAESSGGAIVGLGLGVPYYVPGEASLPDGDICL
jgi:hypothetical protein